MDRNRIAIIDLPGELLAESVSILVDAGISVLGSMSGTGRNMVRLIISGSALPYECAHGDVQIVKAHISVENYGHQRIKRVAVFQTIGPVTHSAEIC